jgi:hypothetical protein
MDQVKPVVRLQPEIGDDPTTSDVKKAPSRLHEVAVI